MSSITAPSPAVDPTGPLVPVARSRRRTELIMLAFAVALTAFAFANVGFSLKGKLPSGIVEYMAPYVVMVVIAHLAMRRFAPWADPLLLPLAALLNGLGIVMTYRLAAQGNLLTAPLSSSATEIQVVYTALGIGCFVAVLALIREPRVLQRYTYTLGAIGILLVALPALLPASISEVAGTGAKIQIRLGTFTIQPEEFAKLALAISFAGYLVAKRDVLALAGRRVLGIDLPRARDLGPILVAWAASLLLLVFESDVGTSAVFMGLFVAMLYIATSRTSWLLLGFVMFVAGAFAASKLFAHVGERFDIWLHPFAGQNPSQQRLPARPGPVRDGQRRPARQGPGRRPAVHHPAGAERPRDQRVRRGTRAGRADGHLADLRADRAARAADRDAGQGPVLQAAGRRPLVHARPAGVRHRRRRHPAHPADRHHHPVPVPGRVLAGGELDADRPAGPAERHRPAPAAAADTGRGTDAGGDAE